MPMQMRHTSEVFFGRSGKLSVFAIRRGQIYTILAVFLPYMSIFAHGYHKNELFTKHAVAVILHLSEYAAALSGLLPHDTKASPMPPFLQNPF